MALYSVAGLSRQVELPVPLKLWIVPPNQTRQRPGIRRQTPGVWVQHETANPRPSADARMHAAYLHQGAPGANGRPQTLSYHFTVDDEVIYQMIPVDEVTWQAADDNGPGNMSGISCELCVNAGIDHARARANAEALAAAIMHAAGVPRAGVRKHQDFSGKYCPALMLGAGYWPRFVANVQQRYDQLAGGGAAYVAPNPPPKPTGSDAVVNGYTFWAIDRTVTAAREAPALRWAGSGSPAVRAPYRAGERFRVIYAVQGAEVDGSRWWYVTPDGARVPQAACLPRVAFMGEKQ